MEEPKPGQEPAPTGSELNLGLGSQTLTVVGLHADTWAVVQADGTLGKFDVEACRRLANGFDPDARLDENKAIARLCIALLESAASKVDHILREGGGTYGDTIRGLSIKA